MDIHDMHGCEWMSRFFKTKDIFKVDNYMLSNPEVIKTVIVDLNMDMKRLILLIFHGRKLHIGKT